MTEQSLNRIPKEHDLKIWSRHFEAVLSGKKKAEHRVNDRDFQEGDTLMLREVTEPECDYTGRKMYVTITHIIRGGEMDILSIEPQNTVSRSEISDAELLRLMREAVYGNSTNLGIETFDRKRLEAIRPYLRTTEPVSVSLEDMVFEANRAFDEVQPKSMDYSLDAIEAATKAIIEYIKSQGAQIHVRD